MLTNLGHLEFLGFTQPLKGTKIDQKVIKIKPKED